MQLLGTKTHMHAWHVPEHNTCTVALSASPYFPSSHSIKDIKTKETKHTNRGNRRLPSFFHSSSKSSAANVYLTLVRREGCGQTGWEKKETWLQGRELKSLKSATEPWQKPHNLSVVFLWYFSSCIACQVCVWMYRLTGRNALQRLQWKLCF